MYRPSENMPSNKSDEVLRSIERRLERIEKLQQNSMNGMQLHRGSVDVVLGAQWGDEGKGKVCNYYEFCSGCKSLTKRNCQCQFQLVDILSGKYDVCARVAGGSNAGHTILVDVRTQLV